MKQQMARNTWGGKRRDITMVDKHLRGTYHRHTEDVADIERTYWWLQRANLKDSTEAPGISGAPITVAIRALGAVTPKLREWLHQIA